MAMSLRCYASAKNNNNSITVCNTAVVLRHENMLSSRWIIIMDFVLWGNSRNAASWNVRLYSVLSSPLVSKLKEVRILAVYCLFPLDLQFQQHKLVSEKTFIMFSIQMSDIFMFYVAWKHEKSRLNPIWPVRLKRISRNAIWIGFQTTYECSSKRIFKNQISCSSLPFRLYKYDRILIRFAQISDLGWQSKRGFRAQTPGR